MEATEKQIPLERTVKDAYRVGSHLLFPFIFVIPFALWTIMVTHVIFTLFCIQLPFYYVYPRPIASIKQQHSRCHTFTWKLSDLSCGGICNGLKKKVSLYEIGCNENKQETGKKNWRKIIYKIQTEWGVSARFLFFFFFFFFGCKMEWCADQIGVLVCTVLRSHRAAQEMHNTNMAT